ADASHTQPLIKQLQESCPKIQDISVWTKTKTPTANVIKTIQLEGVSTPLGLIEAGGAGDCGIYSLLALRRGRISREGERAEEFEHVKRVRVNLAQCFVQYGSQIPEIQALVREVIKETKIWEEGVGTEVGAAAVIPTDDSFNAHIDAFVDIFKGNLSQWKVSINKCEQLLYDAICEELDQEIERNPLSSAYLIDAEIKNGRLPKLDNQTVSDFLKAHISSIVEKFFLKQGKIEHLGSDYKDVLAALNQHQQVAHGTAISEDVRVQQQVDEYVMNPQKMWQYAESITQENSFGGHYHDLSKGELLIVAMQMGMSCQLVTPDGKGGNSAPDHYGYTHLDSDQQNYVYFNGTNHFQPLFKQARHGQAQTVEGGAAAEPAATSQSMRKLLDLWKTGVPLNGFSQNKVQISRSPSPDSERSSSSEGGSSGGHTVLHMFENSRAITHIKPHQLTALKKSLEAVKKSGGDKRALIEAATGAGKTLISFLINHIKFVLENKINIMMFPIKALVRQAKNEYIKYGQEAPVITISDSEYTYDDPQNLDSSAKTFDSMDRLKTFLLQEKERVEKTGVRFNSPQVLCTYNVFRSKHLELSELAKALGIKVGNVVVDEAHHVKQVDNKNEKKEDNITTKSLEEFQKKHNCAVLGFTANKNKDTEAFFGKPVYFYSMKQAVLDKVVKDLRKATLESVVAPRCEKEGEARLEERFNLMYPNKLQKTNKLGRYKNDHPEEYTRPSFTDLELQIEQKRMENIREKLGKLAQKRVYIVLDSKEIKSISQGLELPKNVTWVAKNEKKVDLDNTDHVLLCIPESTCNVWRQKIKKNQSDQGRMEVDQSIQIEELHDTTIHQKAEIFADHYIKW
ncbi:hypothetical protein DID78_07265, partial [Candidatus Marinamargulisbacteria bacterium SCGC AG-343-D04]